MLRVSSVKQVWRPFKPMLMLSAAFILFQTTVKASGTSYDATVETFAHGFLSVVDLQCHRHSLTSFPNSGLPMSTLRNWGWERRGANVRVESHIDIADQLEIADQIYDRNGENATTRCANATRSFDAHLDGRITKWDEGVIAGSFTLQLDSGATREFTFNTGNEPPIDERRHFCEQLNPVGCSWLSRLKQERVRVFYKILDSPDGPSVKPLRIETL